MERWFTRAYARGAGRQSVARVREAYRRCEDEGYTQCCEVLGRLDTWPTLATLALPILLVSGNEDDFSWERADEIAEHLHVERIIRCGAVNSDGRNTICDSAFNVFVHEGTSFWNGRFSSACDET